MKKKKYKKFIEDIHKKKPPISERLILTWFKFLK